MSNGHNFGFVVVLMVWEGILALSGNYEVHDVLITLDVSKNHINVIYYSRGRLFPDMTFLKILPLLILTIFHFLLPTILNVNL